MTDLFTDRMTDLLIDRPVDWVTYCLQNTEFLTCVSNAALNVSFLTELTWQNLTSWLSDLPSRLLSDWYI